MSGNNRRNPPAGHLAGDWTQASLVNFLRVFYPERKNSLFNFEGPVERGRYITEQLELFEDPDQVHRLVQVIEDHGYDAHDQRPYAFDRDIVVLILYRHYRQYGGFHLPNRSEATTARKNARTSGRDTQYPIWGPAARPRRIVHPSGPGTSFMGLNAPPGYNTSAGQNPPPGGSGSTRRPAPPPPIFGRQPGFGRRGGPPV